MSNMALRFAAIAVLVLAGCGKNEGRLVDSAPPSAQSYVTEDGECFAGIVMAVEAKNMDPTGYAAWREKLNSKDKQWLTGFSGAYSTATRIANSHLGQTTKQLYERKVITGDQFNILDGYLKIYQETDPLKAKALSAGACAKVGFSKGTDLN